MAGWLTPKELKRLCEEAIEQGYGDLPVEVHPDVIYSPFERFDFSVEGENNFLANDLHWADDPQKDGFISIIFAEEDDIEDEDDLEPL